MKKELEETRGKRTFLFWEKIEFIRGRPKEVLDPFYRVILALRLREYGSSPH
jgi:hypothetical protein